MGLDYNVGVFSMGCFEEGLCKAGDWWSPEKVVLHERICIAWDGGLISNMLSKGGEVHEWKDISIDISGGYEGDSVDVELWGYRMETDGEFRSRIEGLKHRHQEVQAKRHRQREVAAQLAVMRR